MSKAIYTTFSLDSGEMTLINEQLLSFVTGALQMSATTTPVHMGTLTDTLQHVYQLAAASPAEEHLCVILTDISENHQELLKLLASIPSNVEIQLLTVNAVGARNIVLFQHLRSPQLVFMASAFDDETQQVIDQMISGGNSQN